MGGPPSTDNVLSLTPQRSRSATPEHLATHNASLLPRYCRTNDEPACRPGSDPRISSISSSRSRSHNFLGWQDLLPQTQLQQIPGENLRATNLTPRTKAAAAWDRSRRTSSPMQQVQSLLGQLLPQEQKLASYYDPTYQALSAASAGGGTLSLQLGAGMPDCEGRRNTTAPTTTQAAG